MLTEDAGVELRVCVRERLTFDVAFAKIIGSQRFAQQVRSLTNHIVFPSANRMFATGAPSMPASWRIERRKFKIVCQQ